MGLSRLWWIPAGRPPTEGAYVYYDAQGTLGTLAAAAAAGPDAARSSSARTWARSSRGCGTPWPPAACSAR